ncbi:MAG TPA: ornithine carbamoyltransferase [Candidatus Limnocylindria bacterium]|nr:ornithine carbamoyltransferase [Candidatus Limnocylindria bacterium]
MAGVATAHRPKTGSDAESAIPNAPRHLLSAADLVGIGLERLLVRAESLRRDRLAGRRAPLLAGRQVALLFEKPSLRTRVSFDVGVNLLGGHAVYLGPDEVGLGRRETPADVARNLSRWVDAIVLRTFAHRTLVELAEASAVPVVNALTDREHPCQALADLLTLRQRLGSLCGRRLAFVGDGNNVCHSLLLAGATAGLEMRVATPAGYEPDASVVSEAGTLARLSGGSVVVGDDPRAAVKGVDAVYTDVWASMGAEPEAAARRERFAGFRVDARLLAGAPRALVMHCLPAHRGEEISDEALDGPHSVVLDQAENRLYVQQALLLELLEPELR